MTYAIRSDVAASIPFDNETNGFTAENVQDAIEEARGSFVGKGFQSTFVENGTAINDWLKQEDANVPSNESPDIFKYKARLVGIDFTNSNNNADPIIKIAIRSYPFTNLNSIDRSYKWTLSNIRSAIKTNQDSGFIINAGDCIGVYVQDGGGNSSDVVVTMDFIVLEAPTTALSINYTGNFNSNDFPSLGSIPEILP